MTAYLSDSSYRSRNILGLVTSVVLEDASGSPVSKTETFYDEANYAMLALGWIPEGYGSQGVIMCAPN